MTGTFLRSLEYYDLTFPIARLSGLLKRDFGRQGKTISLADATIAAVAIVNGLTLITNNVKDFPMNELSLYPLAN